jgi:hypothetical protein
MLTKSIKMEFDEYFMWFCDELEKMDFDGNPCEDTALIYKEDGLTPKAAARQFIKDSTSDVIRLVSKDTMDSGLEDMEDRMMKSYKQKTFAVIAKLDEIGVPEKGWQLRLITKRSFNAIAFLKWIHSLEGYIEEALFCIYSINHEASKIINDMVISGEIGQATILMSNLRNKAHRSKEEATKNYFITNPNIELIFASSHSKIMTFKTKKGNFYTVEGSGNLSYNSRIEQYVIDNDENVFNFTKDWVEEIKIYLQGKKELEIYPKNGITQ